MKKEVREMWVIFILAFAVIALVAVLVVVAAVWLVHKVSNAMIREDRQLEKEEKLNRGE
ncbi:MAG: hypothetical protein K1W22_17550 [Lachnospiraceae bacterium]